VKKKILKFSVKAFVSVFFTYLVIAKTNWPEVFFYLKKIEFWQIGLYVIVLIIGMWISSYKWQKLAEYKGIILPQREFFKHYLTGTFINNFMPSFIAGDTYKAIATSGEDKRYSEAASAVMMDRITGLVGIMILSLIFSILNYKIILNNQVLLVINALIVISLCTDLIIAKLKKISALKKLVYRFIPEKGIKFLQDLSSYGNNGDIIKRAIWLALFFSVVGVAFLNYILFWGLGVEISLSNYLSVIFLISIISALPISINNIGLKEWAYITFFGYFGITSGAVVAVSVISRFLQMIVSCLALPIYIRSKSLKKL
jgi:glycosyltransferase 2 family protein